MKLKILHAIILLALTTLFVSADPVTPWEAKNQGVGWYGSVQGIVTSIFPYNNSCVIEAEDRSSAITISGRPQGANIGDEVIITGSLLSDRSFLMSYFSFTGRTNIFIDPVGLSNRDIGGATATSLSLDNLDLLVRTWGKVLDSPQVYSDGTTRFFIDDGSASAAAPAIPPEGTILFSDNFNSRNPQWVDYGTATTVQNGQLVAAAASGASNKVVLSGISMADAAVSVDAVANSTAGIILRYRNTTNYVIAIYSSENAGRLYFYEVVNGSGLGNILNYQYIPYLAGKAHILAVAKGPLVTITVTDGNLTYRNTWPLSLSSMSAGSVGLYHDTSGGVVTQYFDNFSAVSANVPISPDAVQVVIAPQLDSLGQVITPPLVDGGGFVFRGDYLKAAGAAGRVRFPSGGPWMRRVRARELEDFGWFTGASGQPTERMRTSVVTLATDGTGDFGPQTPGTSTAGWQEAINYCVANNCDLYAGGGWIESRPDLPDGKVVSVYQIWDTIKIPATQNFTIYGGTYAFGWNGWLVPEPNTDMVLVDSGKNCHYWLGMVVYSGAGAIIRVKPQNAIPGDGTVGFVNSSIRASSVAGAGGGLACGGMVFDTSAGPITNNDFFITAALFLVNCITMPSTGYDFAYNHLLSWHTYTEMDNGTCFKIGEKSHHNFLDIGVSSFGVVSNLTGVDLAGHDNTISLNAGWGCAPGKHLIFESAAYGNVVGIMPSVDWNADPMSLVTDLSTGTNQINAISFPMTVRTVAATVGTYLYTQNLCPATVRISGGTVSSVQLQRGGSTIDYGASPASIRMNVGDKLRIVNTVAPTLTVIPVKPR